MIALAPPSPVVTTASTPFATIASGVTSGGQRWRLRAEADHDGYVAGLSLPLPGDLDAGAYESHRLPAATYLSAETAHGLGRKRDEQEVDGVVGARVARLRVTTASGTVTIRPRTNPAAALRRYPQLKRLKLYVKFLDAAPQKVEALDTAGRVIASQKL
jgi:hypothetical protein